LSISPPASRRWWTLAVLALTQLVVVLDATIVTIALPQAQQELGLTDVERQWVVTAYVLAFGALLLLGGRIADYWGRKRAFMVGMVGFGLASAFGGFAQNGTELIVARGLQGVFAALLAPAALSLLTVTFTSGRDRNTAFAVFGIIGGSGAAVGLLLGGALTEFTSWRWCLLVNVIFVIVGVIGGILFVKESKAEGDNRYDIWGTITVALGLGSLVYGFSLAEEGWGSINTIGFLALGVGLLALFVLIESRVSQPLLPLRVILNRVRGGAFILQAIVGSVLLGATLYLTFYIQIVILIAVPVLTNALPTIGPRPLMIVGPLFAAAGLFYLSFITADGNYFTQVLPALVLLGLGLAAIFVPLQNLALTGVAPHDAGAASAAVNASMQIGGSIGISVFTAIYAQTMGDSAASGSEQFVAFTDGYSAVFVAAAIVMVAASLVAVFLIRGKKEDLLPQHGQAASVHMG
jgi:EmrB/QacA subfamily drug resistance transporter